METIACLVLLVAAQDPLDPQDLPEPAGEKVWIESFFPAGLLYRPYLADPRQSKTSVKVVLGGGQGAGSKIENTLGVMHAIYRWEEPGRDGDVVELAFEAAAFSRFDRDEHWDLEATDYRFGFPLSYKTGDVIFKFHIWHMTSHLGDEYHKRTDRELRKYHLDEAAFGISWEMSNMSRLYAEFGLAFYAGPETESGRIQFGYEWTEKDSDEGTTPYLAFELSSRNDIEWGLNKIVAAGLMFKVAEKARALRIGLELYHGRDVQTQFLEQQERGLSLVVAMDLF
jgi:hypothetical protein